MLLVLVKHSLITTSDSHFAGGKHAFLCMAKTLAASGDTVHVVHTSDKATVMLYCMQHNLLGKTTYDSSAQHVVHFEHDGVLHHVVLTDVVAELARQAGITCAQGLESTIVNKCSGITATTGDFWIVVDADQSQLTQHAQHAQLAQHAQHAQHAQQQGPGTQHAQQQGPSAQHAQQQGPGAQHVQQQGPSQEHAQQQQQGRMADSCLFAGLAQGFGRRVVAVVQNVHFLPFGPSGSSRRTQQLLAAWQGIGGVLCVSCFVHDYVLRHAQQQGVQLPSMCVLPVTAWGVFGTGPFPDYGAEVGAKLVSGEESGPPVVGMLKLTPEKGAAIFFELARRLPDLRFMGVSADPAVQAHARYMHNVCILPPMANVEFLLRELWLLLVPSIWLEAFGMVVMDAQLRGVPAIVSELGGLPEAGLGTAQSVPVNPIAIPPGPDGTPDWARRSYPHQPVDEWEATVRGVLSDAAAYRRRSTACRQASLAHVQAQPQFVQQFRQWLCSLQPPGGSRAAVDVQQLSAQMSNHTLGH